MRRGIWIGAAVLIAFAAAIPVWLVLDDDGGERTQGALTQPTRAALDCSAARVRGCPELNQLLATLDAELQGDQGEARIAATQTSIKENSFYKAALVDALTQQDQLALQQALERQQQTMSMLSNLSKKYAETHQAIINNLK